MNEYVFYIVLYNDLESLIRKNLKKTVGETIIRNNKKNKEGKEVKEKRRLKKEARKEFMKACKNKEDIKEKLNKYIQSQINLKAEIEKQETKQTKLNLEKLIKEGGVKSQMFWKIRRKLLANSETEYDIIDDSGRKLENPEEAKEHVAQYFEELYKARECKQGYEEWTQKIIEKNITTFE